jgi:hypothetical protein
VGVAVNYFGLTVIGAAVWFWFFADCPVIEGASDEVFSPVFISFSNGGAPGSNLWEYIAILYEL